MAANSPAAPSSQRGPFRDVFPPGADRVTAPALTPSLDGMVVQRALQLRERVHAPHQHEGLAEQAQVLDRAGVATHSVRSVSAISLGTLAGGAAAGEGKGRGQAMGHGRLRGDNGDLMLLNSQLNQ